MLAFRISFSVKGLDPKLISTRKQVALHRAGLAWQAGIRAYPPPLSPPSVRTYMRTGLLGRTAYYKVAGDRVEFWGRAYGLYVLVGTGIFGPRKDYIRPRRARMMAWVSDFTQKVVFASKVKGTIWPGKLRGVEEKIIKGVRSGFRGVAL